MMGAPMIIDPKTGKQITREQLEASGLPGTKEPDWMKKILDPIFHFFGGIFTPDPSYPGPDNNYNRPPAGDRSPRGTRGPGGARLGMLGGGYQVASAGDSWAYGGGFSSTIETDPLARMLRDYLSQLLEKLSDILDTLTDMAEGQGSPRTARSRGITGTAQTGVPGDQAQNAGDLMKMVMEEWGVSQDEAAPIVSAMLRESKGHADISYGGGPYQMGTDIAVGLFQHTGSRHRRLEAWARENNLNPKDPRTQVRYAHWEATHDPAYAGWRAALHSSDPEAFGDLFEAGGQHGGYRHGTYIEDLRHMPLGSEGGIGAGEFLRRQHERRSGVSGNNFTTNVSVVAPNPGSAAMQVAEQQDRVFQQHIRYAKGSLV
jgi:hypothetical protein